GVQAEPVVHRANESGRLRDACRLVAGQQPYRECPMDWSLRDLEQAGSRIVDAQTVPILYRERFVHSQLDLCMQSVNRLHNRALAAPLQGHISDPRTRALAHIVPDAGLRHRHDYIRVAETGTWRALTPVATSHTGPAWLYMHTS